MEAATELSFERTVPCSIAHRRALGEVFVADSAQTGEDEFTLAIQLPRSHCVWFDREVDYHDTLSTAEAARQGAFVVVHRHLGVPVGLPFSLQRFEVAVSDVEAYRDDKRTPLEGLLRFTLTERDMRTDEIGSLAFEGELTIGGVLAMTMAGGITFLPARDYTALRDYQRSRKPIGDAPTPATERMESARVGRRDPRNVVIGAPSPAQGGETRYPLVIDRGHPSFFDHDYDHVPGPLMVEAWRQAALVTATDSGALPSPAAATIGCEMSFRDFAEFEALLECSTVVTEAAPGGRVTVAVAAHQFGNQIGEGAIALAPYPG